MNQIRNVQYVVQSWRCIGINGIECTNLLTNINSRKPKRRCTECQHKFRKARQLELFYKRKRECNRKKFLEGNV